MTAPVPVRAGTEVLEAAVADPGGRALEIDAIRGWAALSVMLFHIFWETLGVAVPTFRNPYTAVLLAGRFDVILFFILSGDALSFPFFHGGDERYLQRAALKRYPRLTVPIVVVTAVTAAVMACGLVWTGPASIIVGRTDWLRGFAWATPTLTSAVRFAFVEVFSGGGPINYLPFLWTMPIELLGSLVLILILFVFRRLRFATLFVLTATIASVGLAGSFIGCFLIGLLLGKARADGVYDRLPIAVRRYGSLLGIAFALKLVGHWQAIGNDQLRSLAGGGAILLFCIYANPRITAFLARDPLSQFLGRISYLLYLWHYVVLISVTSGLIVLAARPDGTLLPATALGIGAVTVVLSIVISHATLSIERFTRSVNGWFLRVCWSENADAARPPRRNLRLPALNAGSRPGGSDR